MHRHLVPIEVSVVGRTYQWMQLDCLTFDQHGLKGLNTKAVQSRRPVQQHRMLSNDLCKNIPDFRWLSLNHLLGRLDRAGQSAMLQLAKNERLEQFQRHFLGQTTLMQSQGRTGHNDRTSGVVDPLTQKVLTETALLALDHIGQGLERTLV